MTSRRPFPPALAAALCAAAFGPFVSAPVRAQAPPATEVAVEPKRDVPYVPTPSAVVDKMHEMAEVMAGDVVYDLGCGDGRIVIAAVLRPGARGVCVDIDPARVEESRANAARAGVADRIRFVQGDLFEVPLAEATVVTMYLLPSVNMRLRPRLLTELRRGTRIVSHAFDLGDWRPRHCPRSSIRAISW